MNTIELTKRIKEVDRDIEGMQRLPLNSENLGKLWNARYYRHQLLKQLTQISTSK